MFTKIGMEDCSISPMFTEFGMEDYWIGSLLGFEQ